MQAPFCRVSGIVRGCGADQLLQHGLLCCPYVGVRLPDFVNLWHRTAHLAGLKTHVVLASSAELSVRHDERADNRACLREFAERHCGSVPEHVLWRVELPRAARDEPMTFRSDDGRTSCEWVITIAEATLLAGRQGARVLLNLLLKRDAVSFVRGRRVVLCTHVAFTLLAQASVGLERDSKAVSRHMWYAAVVRCVYCLLYC